MIKQDIRFIGKYVKTKIWYEHPPETMTEAIEIIVTLQSKLTEKQKKSIDQIWWLRTIKAKN